MAAADVRNQGISSYGIDPVFVEYSRLSTRKVKVIII